MKVYSNKIILSFLLLIVVGNIHANAQKLAYLPSDSMKFKITIIKYYFGRVDNRIIATQDSLSYETDVHKGNSEKISRLLNDVEKKKIKESLKQFPLNQLKDEYINPGVKDGTQISFSFDIHNQSKEIFIGNVYQENLGELVKLIVPMLPEDYILYKKENIYPY